MKKWKRKNGEKEKELVSKNKTMTKKIFPGTN